MTTPLFGGIEAGGTKFVCAVGTGADDLRAQARFDTTSPEETLAKVIDFFNRQQSVYGKLAALGIASFGPLDLNPASPTYGSITSTPKPGWANTRLVAPIRQALGVPVAFDTDVNAAALGEKTWGAAQELETVVYLTVGTGIGGGVLINGGLARGLVHPEMGHIRLSRDAGRDPFAGICPYHGDCFEGLASGPALKARWGESAESLPPDHPAWQLEAHYIGQALAVYVCVLSPQRIILGGGVMAQRQLFSMVRAETQALLNGYVQSPAIQETIDQYIVPPALGARAGVLGAIALARQTAQG